MNKNSLPQTIVDAFQDLSDYLKGKWMSSIATVFFLAFTALIGVGVYFIYNNLDKGIKILESTYNTPESLQDGLVTSVAENMAIDKELTNALLGSKNAVAIVYFKFHNTKTDLQGKHDFYYSGVNEISRDPLISFLPQTQSIPITRLGQFMIPFLEDKCQTIDVKEITGNSWLKIKLKSDGIGIMSSCPVYDKTGRYLIGFVEMIYPEGTPPARTLEGIEECLSVISRKISLISKSASTQE